MSDVVRAAVRKTSEIVMEADMAIELLEGFGHSRINALGILRDPPAYLLALQSARAAIDRAIMDHRSTGWPSAADYGSF